MLLYNYSEDPERNGQRARRLFLLHLSTDMETIECYKSLASRMFLTDKSPGKDSALRTYTMELKIFYSSKKANWKRHWRLVTTVFETRETEC